MSATFPILEITPVIPCVFTTPIKSKLFRLNQSNSILMRLSTRPIDVPILSSCFFSYVSSEFAGSIICKPYSVSLPVGLHGSYEAYMACELVTSAGRLSPVTLQEAATVTCETPGASSAKKPSSCAFHAPAILQLGIHLAELASPRLLDPS